MAESILRVNINSILVQSCLLDLGVSRAQPLSTRKI